MGEASQPFEGQNNKIGSSLMKEHPDQETGKGHLLVLDVALLSNLLLTWLIKGLINFAFSI